MYKRQTKHDGRAVLFAVAELLVALAILSDGLGGRYVRMYPFPANNMNITLADWPQKLGGTNASVVPGS